MTFREERGTWRRDTRARALRCTVAAAAFVAAVAAGAAEGERHVRGVVSAVAGDTLTVKTQDGRAQQLKLEPKSRVSYATRADLGAIGKGAWVGTTALQAKDGAAGAGRQRRSRASPVCLPTRWVRAGRDGASRGQD